MLDVWDWFAAGYTLVVGAGVLWALSLLAHVVRRNRGARR